MLNFIVGTSFGYAEKEEYNQKSTIQTTMKPFGKILFIITF